MASGKLAREFQHLGQFFPLCHARDGVGARAESYLKIEIRGPDDTIKRRYGGHLPTRLVR